MMESNISCERGTDSTDFEAAEHQNLGEIKLRYPGRDANTYREYTDNILKLPNNLGLTFGQIIALAGDFYGVPNDPIIDLHEEPGKQMSGRQGRFMEAYNTLARAPDQKTKTEVDLILSTMTKEGNGIANYLSQDQHKTRRTKVPSNFYKKCGLSLTKEYDTITGGKWMSNIPVVMGRVMKLALNNHDHFQPYSTDAYIAGHQLALEKAAEVKSAQEDEKIKILEEAYSIDAFACHFLTDSFSSGHIRTPRIELPKNTTISKVGHYLVKQMHDEDGKNGLHVTNERGDKWMAYGDGMLFNRENEENNKIAVSAVQESANQVFAAFQNPDEIPNPKLITKFVPTVDLNANNNSPMFKVKDGKLYRRKHLNNLRDAKTTANWYGVTNILRF